MQCFQIFIQYQISGNINPSMTDIHDNVHHQQQDPPIPKLNHSNRQDDLSDFNMSEDPFDQLQLSQSHQPIQHFAQEQENAVSYNPVTPSKADNFMQKQLEEDEYQKEGKLNSLKEKTPKKLRIAQKRQKKLRKQEKSLKKKSHRKAKNKQRKLKRLAKENGSDISFNNSDDEDSLSSLDESSDSFLENLNPRKKNRLTKTSKKEKTEKKEGFSLKELGNEGQIDFDEHQSESQGKKKKGKKQKKQAKKQVATNQDLLKKLLQMKLCVQEQENIDGEEQQHLYDDGIDALNEMKGKEKKKGPKITNKLFSDINIDQNQFQNQEAPEDIQLDVKPRQQRQISTKVSSFLGRAEKLKKILSSDSISKDISYDRISSDRAKESMIKLVKSQKIDEGQQIELDVKVPTIAKGRLSGEINNSMFFRRFSKNIQRIQSEQEKTHPSPVKSSSFFMEKPTKISRKQIFSSLVNDMKQRKSKNITHELIAKSFKITQLQEIQHTRKKNEQKRRRQALKGSDQECQSEDQLPNEGQSQLSVKQKNQQLLDKQKIQNNEEGEDKDNYSNQDDNLNKDEISIEKQKEKPEPPKVIDQKEYQRLLLLEEGEAEQNMGNSSQQNQMDDIERELQMQEEFPEQNDQQHNQQEAHKQIEEDGYKGSNENSNEQQGEEVSQSNSIEVEVDLQVKDINGFIQPKKKNRFLIQSDEEEEAKESQSKQVSEKIILSEIQGQQLQEREVYVKIPKEPIDEKENILSDEALNFNKNPSQSQNKDPSINASFKNHEEMRSQFKKLRKLATIIKQKKTHEKKMKIASDMFEEEAQQGSDNEEHDNQVKAINDEDEERMYEGINLDADLEEFLDNAVDMDEENEDYAFRKYLQDVKIQDRDELKRILSGDFKRQRLEMDNLVEEIDEEDQERNRRMDQMEEYIRKKQEEEGREHYINDSDEEKQQQQEEEVQIVDQFNQENLKRYLDDTLIDSKKFSTKKIIKPKKQLPESYKRERQLQKRNTMKSNSEISEKNQKPNIMFNNQLGSQKLKKTTSHLNELIMKNKQKVKPIGVLRALVVKKK